MKTAGLMAAVLLAMTATMRPDGSAGGHQSGVRSLAFGVQGGSSEPGTPNAQPQPRVDGAAAVRRELSQEFHFQPAAKVATAPASPVIAEQKVEKLEPVVVTAPSRTRQLESELRQRAQALKDRRFSLLNGGGTLHEHKGKKVRTEIQLKLVPVWEGAGVHVLSLSW